MSSVAFQMPDGAVVDMVPLSEEVFYCSDRDPPHYTWFLAPKSFKPRHRTVVTEALFRGFKDLHPKKARGAATEAVRLMEEDAAELGEGWLALYFTLPVSNLAWMAVGVPPEMGDRIAEAKNRIGPPEPTP